MVCIFDLIWIRTLAVKDFAECRFTFLQITVWLFEFQTNFGVQTPSFQFAVVFLISKPMYGIISNLETQLLSN